MKKILGLISRYLTKRLHKRARGRISREEYLKSLQEKVFFENFIDR